MLYGVLQFVYIVTASVIVWNSDIPYILDANFT